MAEIKKLSETQNSIIQSLATASDYTRVFDRQAMTKTTKMSLYQKGLITLVNSDSRGWWFEVALTEAGIEYATAQGWITATKPAANTETVSAKAVKLSAAQQSAFKTIVDNPISHDYTSNNEHSIWGVHKARVSELSQKGFIRVTDKVMRRRCTLTKQGIAYAIAHGWLTAPANSEPQSDNDDEPIIMSEADKEDLRQRFDAMRAERKATKNTQDKPANSEPQADITPADIAAVEAMGEVAANVFGEDCDEPKFAPGDNVVITFEDIRDFDPRDGTIAVVRGVTTRFQEGEWCHFYNVEYPNGNRATFYEASLKPLKLTPSPLMNIDTAQTAPVDGGSDSGVAADFDATVVQILQRRSDRQQAEIRTLESKLAAAAAALEAAYTALDEVTFSVPSDSIHTRNLISAIRSKIRKAIVSTVRKQSGAGEE